MNFLCLKMSVQHVCDAVVLFTGGMFFPYCISADKRENVLLSGPTLNYVPWVQFHPTTYNFSNKERIASYLGLDKSEFLLAVLQRARWLHREHIGKETIWRHFLLRAVPPRVSGKAPKHLEYNLQLNAGGRALADCAKTTCFPVQRLKYPQKQRMGVGNGTLV